MKKEIILKYLYLACLSGAVLFLGFIYAIHNTDPHHWGFILGTAKDYIHGRNLFSQVYIQYGAGLPIIFSFINQIIPVNYASIGFIVTCVYAVNFIVIFFCIEKVSSTAHAVTLTFIAFLFHPFPTYPWPDYMAGLCLSFFCYFILTDTDDEIWYRPARAGFLLFFAFFFRNTYLISITLAGGGYLLLSLLNRRVRNKNILLSIVVFFGLILVYLSFLMFQGTILQWYLQTMGAASKDYKLGTNSIMTFILEIIYPNSLTRAVLSGLLAINLYNILNVLIKHEKLVAISAGAVVFIALLGGGGLIQGMQFYDRFRLQNACFPLYIGLAYFLAKNLIINQSGWRSNLLKTSFGSLVVMLVAAYLYFPNPSTAIFSILSDISTYSNSKVPIFYGHRHKAEVDTYYKNLIGGLCDGEKRIVNLTQDSVIPYLCSDQLNSLNLPFYSDSLLSNINLDEGERIRQGKFKENELVVADSSSILGQNTNLIKIALANRPASILMMKADEVSVYRIGTD